MNSIILLAAGKGKRMNTSLPKCAFPLLNKPLIEYLYQTVSQIESIHQIICVVGYQKEIIQSILLNRVIYAFQECPLGTADAIKSCEGLIDNIGYSIILNGDTPLITKEIIEELIKFHQINKNDFSLLSTDLDNPFSYGRVIRDENNNIIEICEEKDLKEEMKNNKEVNLGIYIINNNLLFDALNKIKISKNNEYYFTDIIKILIEDKKCVSALKVQDNYRMHGINDLITLSKIEKNLIDEIRNKYMANGVFLINSDSIIIENDVKIKKGTIIYPNTILSGDTRIGENCIIGPNSEIKNSIIENNVTCKHSVVEDSVIKDNTTIGPFAHLRMKTIIGENNRIGNFVEIKNSSIGNNTNAAHLTYIGDTTCGDRVNFGCGVVTVNYDGIKKHHTLIGNDVFIGCNSNLIAPVNIGNDVFIAAGSTITSSLSDYDFSIARSRQVTKKNYSAKYKANTR